MHNKFNIVRNLSFYFCLIYILARPFLLNYVSSYIKYLFFFIYLFAFLITLIKGNLLKKVSPVLLFVWLIFLVYIIMSDLFMGDKEMLYISLLNYIVYSFPFFIIVPISNKINFINVFKFLVVFGVLDSLIAIYEFMSKQLLFPTPDVPTIGYDYGSHIVYRSVGLNGSFFLLAITLGVCGLTALYMYNLKRNKLYLGALMLISTGILTTSTRGVYVAYIVAVSYFLYVNKKEYVIKSGLKVKVILSFFASIFAIMFLGNVIFSGIQFENENLNNVFFRVRSIFNWKTDSANLERISIWKKSISIWEKNVFFGNGASITNSSYSKYIGVTESGILLRLVEFGIVGTILQYFTLFYPFAAGKKKLNRQKENNSAQHLFISIIIFIMTEDTILQIYGSLEAMAFLWTSLAFVYSQRDNEKN